MSRGTPLDFARGPGRNLEGGDSPPPSILAAAETPNPYKTFSRASTRPGDTFGSEGVSFVQVESAPRERAFAAIKKVPRDSLASADSFFAQGVALRG